MWQRFRGQAFPSTLYSSVNRDQSFYNEFLFARKMFKVCMKFALK